MSKQQDDGLPPYDPTKGYDIREVHWRVYAKDHSNAMDVYLDEDHKRAFLAGWNAATLHAQAMAVAPTGNPRSPT